MRENDPNNKSRLSSRLFEVDVVKAFAILWMVFMHVYEQLSGIDYLREMPVDAFRNTIEFLGGPLTAPVFMFSMGIGMVYTKHDSPSDFAKRGLKLFIGGFALNFARQTSFYIVADIIGVETGAVFSTLESLFISDILHLAGLSFLLIALLKVMKLKSAHILGIAIIMLILGSMATVSAGSYTYEAESTVPTMLLGLLIFSGKTTAFPLLLWFVFPASGMVFADILQRVEDRASFYRKTLGVSVVVCALVSILYIWTGHDFRQFYTTVSEQYYRSDLYHYIFILSVVLMALSLAFFLFRGLEQTKPGKFISYCSMNLNTIYVCQWMTISFIMTAMVLLDIGKVGAAGVVSSGIIVAAVAIGLSYVWKKLRSRFKKKE